MTELSLLSVVANGGVVVVSLGIVGWLGKKVLNSIETSIKDNRAEQIRTGSEIKDSVDVLAEYQRVANGRTGKLEGSIREITVRCEER